MDPHTPYSLSSVMPAPAPPKRRGQLPLWIGLGVFAVLAIGGGVVAGNLVLGSDLTIAGTMQLSDQNLNDFGPTCKGQGGYADIKEGAQVVITDEAGKTLALTRLGAGTSPAMHVCSFAFSAKVPKASFYGIEVSRRGRVQYSLAEVSDGVTLTLGR